MPTSLSTPDSQPKPRRWPVTALLICGAICVALLGYFIAFPGEASQKSQAETHLGLDPVQTAKKQGRYEGVIANWNRYRAKNLRADAQ
jgi:hypothetical protein